MQRAVRKVGDCFGADCSGEPFERMIIVFLNGYLEQFKGMTIISELVHYGDVWSSWSLSNGLSHLVWVDGAERLTNGKPLATFSSERSQFFASRFLWPVTAQNFGISTTLLFKAHLALELLDAELISYRYILEY